jgi:histidinol phosphatase-like PHP family hydrolase
MTRDDIIKLAREAGFEEWVIVDHLDELERFASLVAAHEREACAQLCAEQEDDDYYTGNQYAQAIRARSQE